MAALFFVLLLFFLLIPFLLVIFVALGLLLFVRPHGLRPAWWDWGLDEPRTINKVEKASEVEIAPVVAIEKPPEVVATEPVKPGLTRW